MGLPSISWKQWAAEISVSGATGVAVQPTVIQPTEPKRWVEMRGVSASASVRPRSRTMAAAAWVQQRTARAIAIRVPIRPVSRIRESSARAR